MGHTSEATKAAIFTNRGEENTDNVGHGKQQHVGQFSLAPDDH
jgi:hypothetical protein